jgi:hypothetical protein
MKKFFPILVGILVAFTFAYFKHNRWSFFETPVEKYNAFVSLSNTCVGFGDRQLTNHTGKYEYLTKPEYLNNLIQSIESQIERVKKISDDTGTKDAALALGEFCVQAMKTDYKKIIDEAQGKDPAAIKVLADSILAPKYEAYEKIISALEEKITAFALANHIERKTINPRPSSSR